MLGIGNSTIKTKRKKEKIKRKEQTIFQGVDQKNSIRVKLSSPRGHVVQLRRVEKKEKLKGKLK